MLPRFVVRPVLRAEPGGTGATSEEYACWCDRLAEMVDFD